LLCIYSIYQLIWIEIDSVYNTQDTQDFVRTNKYKIEKDMEEAQTTKIGKHNLLYFFKFIFIILFR